MSNFEFRTAKVQYHTTKHAKDGEKIQNCRVALTKSLIEKMGFYEGCLVDVVYDYDKSEIKITLKQ